jgi:hypothetical protein
MSELTEQFSGSASSFGVLYPMHYLMALVPSGAVATAAVAALGEAGFAADDVVAFPPEVFVELVEAHRENKGLWNQFLESLSRIVGTEAAYIDLDLDLARNGAGAVAVRAEDAAAKALARATLLRFEPLAMRYYAHLAIEVDIEHPNTQTSAQQSGVD